MPSTPRPQPRLTIGLLMLVVAGSALAIGLTMLPGAARVLGGVALLTVLAIVAGLLGARRIMELAYGHRCPNCDRRGLERRALQSFGERFFSCPSCGVRCRRSLLGSDGLFLWKDASGPEFDTFYAKPVVEDPWNAPPGLEDEEDVIHSKTHLTLVRNKRRRTPENPNGPGLE